MAGGGGQRPRWFADVQPDQVERFGKVIERYWQWTDEQVGRILAYYEGKNPFVLVVSDHGAGPAVGQYQIHVPEYLHLSVAHRDKGVLIAAGPGVREGKTMDGASIYGITPPLAGNDAPLSGVRGARRRTRCRRRRTPSP